MLCVIDLLPSVVFPYAFDDLQGFSLPRFRSPEALVCLSNVSLKHKGRSLGKMWITLFERMSVLAIKRR